jgi:hypothetical protein
VAATIVPVRRAPVEEVPNWASRMDFNERAQCPLLAQSRHEVLHRTCPLLRVKQTWLFAEVRFRGRYRG